MKNIVVTKEIKKEYISALYNLQFGSKTLMADFINNHPEEYKLITTMYRRRCDLTDTLETMKLLNEPIYWFTLTFNNEKDTNNIETKRKEAQRFLNRICSVYVMVEEFGEDNGRYHIHGFLCFRYGYGFIDFVQWHSRQKIIELDNGNKRIKYLTDYSSKQAPRIRRSKALSVLYTYFKKHKRMYKLFNSTFIDNFNKQVANVVNPF